MLIKSMKVMYLCISSIHITFHQLTLDRRRKRLSRSEEKKMKQKTKRAFKKQSKDLQTSMNIDQLRQLISNTRKYELISTKAFNLHSSRQDSSIVTISSQEAPSIIVFNQNEHFAAIQRSLEDMTILFKVTATFYTTSANYISLTELFAKKKSRN